MKGNLIYFGDPMCSWCYGIAEHLEKLISNFKEKLEFELVLGGLRPGGGEEWNPAFKDFLREHWDHVHKASGQPFSYDLLNWEYFNYDTEPSCRAVRVIRDLAPEKEFAFFKACQYRFYFENKNPLFTDFYLPICEKLVVSKDSFIAKFESTKYKKLVTQDFVKSQEFGVRGFPAIVLFLKDQYYMIANGYSTFEKMKNRVDTLLEK